MAQQRGLLSMLAQMFDRISVAVPSLQRESLPTLAELLDAGYSSIEDVHTAFANVGTRPAVMALFKTRCQSVGLSLAVYRYLQTLDCAEAAAYASQSDSRGSVGSDGGDSAGRSSLASAADRVYALGASDEDGGVVEGVPVGSSSPLESSGGTREVEVYYGGQSVSVSVGGGDCWRDVAKKAGDYFEVEGAALELIYRGEVVDPSAPVDAPEDGAYARVNRILSAAEIRDREADVAPVPSAPALDNVSHRTPGAASSSGLYSYTPSPSGHASAAAASVLPAPVPGKAGLLNQGATCYLNSLIQVLHHIPYFTQGVYRMKIEAEEEAALALSAGAAGAKKCIPLALQMLFHALETSSGAVSTRDLTAAFGWGAMETAAQQDVTEFFTLLLDSLRERTIKLDGKRCDFVKELFSGTWVRYTRVTDGLEYESRRTEEFYCLPVSLKGASSVQEALRREYQDEEELDADNLYQVELPDGKKEYHRAARGCSLATVPPVLVLHLGRFEADAYGRAQKVHTRFEFDETLDIAPYVNRQRAAAAEEHRASSAKLTRTPTGGTDPMCREDSTPLPRFNTTGTASTSALSSSHRSNAGEHNESFRSVPPLPRLDSLDYRREYSSPKVPFAAVSTPGTAPLHVDPCAPSTPDAAEPSGPFVYDLHSVMVHSGGAHGGHYYCYVKAPDTKPAAEGDDAAAPGGERTWMCFNDSSVTYSSAADAVAGTYGSSGYSGGWYSRDVSSAYVLTYVRRMHRDALDTPEANATAVERVRARYATLQKKVAEQELARNNYRVKLLTLEDIQQGSACRAADGEAALKARLKHLRGADLIPAARTFTIGKTASLPELYQKAAEATGWDTTEDGEPWDPAAIAASTAASTSTAYGYQRYYGGGYSYLHGQDEEEEATPRPPFYLWGFSKGCVGGLSLKPYETSWPDVGTVYRDFGEAAAGADGMAELVLFVHPALEGTAGERRPNTVLGHAGEGHPGQVGVLIFKEFSAAEQAVRVAGAVLCSYAKLHAADVLVEDVLCEAQGCALPAPAALFLEGTDDCDGEMLSAKDPEPAAGEAPLEWDDGDSDGEGEWGRWLRSQAGEMRGIDHDKVRFGGANPIYVLQPCAEVEWAALHREDDEADAAAAVPPGQVIRARTARDFFYNVLHVITLQCYPLPFDPKQDVCDFAAGVPIVLRSVDKVRTLKRRVADAVGVEETHLRVTSHSSFSGHACSYPLRAEDDAKTVKRAVGCECVYYEALEVPLEDVQSGATSLVHVKVVGKTGTTLTRHTLRLEHGHRESASSVVQTLLVMHAADVALVEGADEDSLADVAPEALQLVEETRGGDDGKVYDGGTEVDFEPNAIMHGDERKLWRLQVAKEESEDGHDDDYYHAPYGGSYEGYYPAAQSSYSAYDPAPMYL
eukprot:TRINITY_DN11546_c0_g2_i1.p1 TRINITY_DN11546_c0_g2~~TRINITY_DN11546_c0_g2_i1.p1  ORF type:complete len:1397 (+),score=440.08 TRINITY_DN11546_c0_g2_i1:166-4356(+)